jgi:hypothetical protein
MLTLRTSATVLTLTGILGAGCATVPPAGPKPAGPTRPTRPNILFIMADDHAWQAIGAYGSDRNVTPGIDRIAREGMRFDRAFVTNAICAPSRAVILSGVYSHLNGVCSTTATPSTRARRPSRACSRGAGYSTAMIGKWHLKDNPRGFDHYEVLIDQGPYYNPTMIRDGERVAHEGYTTDIITDLAIGWLREGRGPRRAVPADVPAQGAAPQLAARAGPHQRLRRGWRSPSPRRCSTTGRTTPRRRGTRR